MEKIELTQCRIWPDKVHINEICSNKYNRCWRKSQLKTLVKIKLDAVKNMPVSGENLLTEELLKE
jgi:hypothetical protein